MRVVLFACAATACDGAREALPTAPSELLTGIVVFDRANFAGGSAHIQGDVADLSNYSGPCEHDKGDDAPPAHDWDDCISSIRLSPNVRATIYVDTKFKGWGVTIDEDVPNLEFVLGPCRRASMNKCITSIRVTSRQ